MCDACLQMSQHNHGSDNSVLVAYGIHLQTPEHNNYSYLSVQQTNNHN